MRSAFILILLLSGMGSTFSIQKILPPVDSAGNSPTITGAGTPRSGLLAISTSDGRFCQSTDLGAHWANIPLPVGTATPEFFGGQLSTSDEQQIWTGSEWRSIVYPATYLQGSNLWISSGVDWSPAMAGAQLPDSSLVFIQSLDSLRSWSLWLQVPVRSLPAGVDIVTNNFLDGSIWMPQKSGARWQITSNGTNWRTVAWPNTSTPNLRWAKGDTVVALTGSARDSSATYQRSFDGGHSWSPFPLNQPGAFTLPLRSGNWITGGYNIRNGRMISVLWVSPDPSGPWTVLSSARAGLAGQDQGLLFQDSTGLYRADLSGLSSIQPGARPAIDFELRRSGGGLIVQVDGIRPLRWTLAAVDGSILASGVATGSFEVPAVRGGAFLTVEGMGAKRLPPL